MPRQAKSSRQWSWRSRRRLLARLVDRWTAAARLRPTVARLYCTLYTLLYTVQVARLLAALAHPAFLDLKLRVETLLGRAQEQAEIERIKQQFIPEY